MKKRYSIVIGLILISIFTIWKVSTPKGLEKKNFILTTLSKGDIVHSITGSGQIQPINVVSVGTQVSGIVEKVYVDYNEEVKKGQILADLDRSLLNEEMKEKEALLTLSKAKLKISKLNYKRIEDLYKENLISKSEFEKAEIDLETASSDLETAEANYAKAKRNLGYTRIVSPVSGTIISKDVDSGQTVAASYQTPTLFTVAEDLSKMQIEANISEADIGLLKKGMTASFTVDAYPNEVFKGEVYQIRLNPTEEENVIMYTVVVRFENKGKKLLPGMTAFVKIQTDKRENVLRIENMVLQFKLPKGLEGFLTEKIKKDLSASETIVYLLKEDKIEPVVIKKGLSDMDYTEILTPLDEKIKIISEYISRKK